MGNLMIPGFNPNLRRNFNHLMYADDQILVTQDSRKSACNIRFCFNICECLTGQKANSNKSAIYFPTRFNKSLLKSTYNILNFKAESFPFTYLGILISLKRLTLSHFSSMLEKIERTISFLEAF